MFCVVQRYMPERNYKEDVNNLLSEVIKKDATDLHLSVGRPPILRVDVSLVDVAGWPVLDVELAKKLILSLLNKDQQEKLWANRDVDLSLTFQDKARFRVNIYFRGGFLAVALRLIPSEIKSVEELNLPSTVLQFAEEKQGFLLVTGPAGEGKTTTLAAVIDHINHFRREHIITIEDPVEFIFKDAMSIIDQREVGRDAVSFAEAIRATLRQDPDVILIGELRDRDSMQTAMTLAETGHLVLASLHTNDAAQTVERIIDTFPADQQTQIRSQLSATLSGVISQRLLPSTGGGRIPAIGIMVASTAIRNAIREGNTHQIEGIIQTSADIGMQTLESSLRALVAAEVVKMEDARPYLSGKEKPN